MSWAGGSCRPHARFPPDLLALGGLPFIKPSERLVNLGKPTGFWQACIYYISIFVTPCNDHVFPSDEPWQAFLKIFCCISKRVGPVCAGMARTPHEMAGQAACSSGVGWQVFLQLYLVENLGLSNFNSVELDRVPERELRSADFVSTVG